MKDGAQLFMISSALIALISFFPAYISLNLCRKQMLNYLERNRRSRWFEVRGNPDIRMGNSIDPYLFNNFDVEDKEIYRLKVKARWSFAITLMSPLLVGLNALLFWYLGVFQYIGPK